LSLVSVGREHRSRVAFTETCDSRDGFGQIREIILRKNIRGIPQSSFLAFFYPTPTRSPPCPPHTSALRPSSQDSPISHLWYNRTFQPFRLDDRRSVSAHISRDREVFALPRRTPRACSRRRWISRGSWARAAARDNPPTKARAAAAAITVTERRKTRTERTQFRSPQNHNWTCSLP